MPDLQGRVALVPATRAGSARPPPGRADAAGALVALAAHDVSRPGGGGGPTGAPHQVIAADLALHPKAVVGQAEAPVGRLDILVNNAGAAVPPSTTDTEGRPRSTGSTS